MKYNEFLLNAQRNQKLNESGLNEYIGVLRREIMDLKDKIVDLEYKLQYKKSKPKEK